MTQALQMQMEVQKRLHEQLEVTNRMSSSPDFLFISVFPIWVATNFRGSIFDDVQGNRNEVKIP